MQDLWIIIWRFQPFHKWHKLLVDTALCECKSLLILIGSSNKEDTKNPYSYELRKDIIDSEISDEKVFISDLPDFDTDEQWMKYILSYIPKIVKSCTIYCWDAKNDSAIKTIDEQKAMLYFEHTVKEIPRSIIPISATQVRRLIAHKEHDQLDEYLLESTINKLIEL